jgi:hypothetical protein
VDRDTQAPRRFSVSLRRKTRLSQLRLVSLGGSAKRWQKPPIDYWQKRVSDFFKTTKNRLNLGRITDGFQGNIADEFYQNPDTNAKQAESNRKIGDGRDIRISPRKAGHRHHHTAGGKAPSRQVCFPNRAAEEEKLTWHESGRSNPSFLLRKISSVCRHLRGCFMSGCGAKLID